jgi:CBS domain-containing protein
MSPNRIGQHTIREAPLLREDTPVAEAARAVVDSGLPALPVIDAERCLAGIFGEREFIAALFPGYLDELRSARFVRREIDSVLDLRQACRVEPVSRHLTADPVAVDVDFSDLEVAETFLHHRVLIVPVLRERQVVGVITRSDFFRVVVERFEALGSRDD